MQSNTLAFSPLRLSDASVYTCYATISSLSLISDVTVMASHDVRIQSELSSNLHTSIESNYLIIQVLATI